MTVRVFRNLDCPFELFGIRGKFIGVAGAMAVACIVIAIVVGSLMSAFVGIATFIVLLALGYLAVSQLQAMLGSLTIERRLAALGMPRFIIINSKVWKQSNSGTVSR